MFTDDLDKKVKSLSEEEKLIAIKRGVELVLPKFESMLEQDFIDDVKNYSEMSKSINYVKQWLSPDSLPEEIIKTEKRKLRKKEEDCTLPDDSAIKFKNFFFSLSVLFDIIGQIRKKGMTLLTFKNILFWFDMIMGKIPGLEKYKGVDILNVLQERKSFSRIKQIIKEEIKLLIESRRRGLARRRHQTAQNLRHNIKFLRKKSATNKQSTFAKWCSAIGLTMSDLNRIKPLKTNRIVKKVGRGTHGFIFLLDDHTVLKIAHFYGDDLEDAKKIKSDAFSGEGSTGNPNIIDYGEVIRGEVFYVRMSFLPEIMIEYFAKLHHEPRYLDHPYKEATLADMQKRLKPDINFAYLISWIAHHNNIDIKTAIETPEGQDSLEDYEYTTVPVLTRPQIFTFANELLELFQKGYNPHDLHAYNIAVYENDDSPGGLSFVFFDR